MTKTINKVGNSQGLMFDSALMDLARLKVGDQVKANYTQELAVAVEPAAAKKK